MTIQLKREDFKKFAPDAKPAYVDALFSNLDKVRASGVTNSPLRWAHFIGQCHAETGGFTILREDLNYKTVAAVRRAWKARASKHSDEWIDANLLRKPVALGDWAYGGRDGNRKGTTDGYDFRGGGWLQTTHANAVREYCRKCNIPFTNDVLDDPVLTLQFALLEWTEGKCSLYADKDDVLSIAKIINTGSAKSGVRPNGMSDREDAVARAKRIWSAATADVESESVRLYPEIVPPTKVAVAAKSWSVRAIMLGMMAKVGEWVDSVFNFLPDAADQAQGLMAPIQSIGEALKINMAEITGLILIGIMIFVAVRHTGDKQSLETLKQGQ